MWEASDHPRKMAGGFRVLYLIRHFLAFLPEVQSADRKITFREKVIYTVISLFISWMVMQLLVGSKIIEVDNSVLEDRALLKVCSSSGCTYYSIKELITTSHKMAKGDRVRHRFSINQLKELCDKLEEDQKDFLRAHGFGNFLNISVFTVPIPPLDFIMRNFKLSVNELQLGNKSIRFTRAMVKQNLGFLCGDVPVDIKNVPPELVEQANC